ncbi:MAG: carboxymuconolactone decarboxylase family protein [Candidatus Binatia bacterium]
MPVIDPVPWDELNPELQEAIRRGQATRMLSTDVTPRVWARRPALAKAQLRVYEEIFERGVLGERLLELVRLRVASLNDCRACRVARKSVEVDEEDVACLSSDSERFDDRERLALRFAELFVLQHDQVDDVLLDELRRHFTAEEIVELGLFVAMVLGLGRLTYVLEAY